MDPQQQRAVAKDGDIVIPGDFLCSASRNIPGTGTHMRHGKLFSTLTGRVKIDPTHSPLPLISVQSSKKDCGAVPEVGCIVVGKVISITERQAKVTLMSVNGKLLQDSLHGLIRREDIRAMEKDSVEMFHSFRPGDIVRARVISLGESQAYALSTAENELGVVMAYSEGGASMVPVSWCEMQCSKTGERERRKVAKVVDAVPL